MKCYSLANYSFFQVWKKITNIYCIIMDHACYVSKDHFPYLIGASGIFRMSSVSFGSDSYGKTRNIVIHGYTDKKMWNILFINLLSNSFETLEVLSFLHFYFSLAFSCLSLSFLVSRALSPIFWGFSGVKHLSHGTWNSALCMFNNMKPFSQPLCTFFAQSMTSLFST